MRVMISKRPRRPPATQSTTSVQSRRKFCLYVAGQTPRSLAAIANLQRICRDHLPGQATIEVIDLMANPRLAGRDQIVALPTLVRHLPRPVRMVIGDLSNTERVLAAMDVPPLSKATGHS
jgi:circadian clock protein KaiB